MSAVLQRHLDAIEAQLGLLQVQFQTLRHALTPPAPPKVTVELPPRPATCEGIAEDRCAFRNEDARAPRTSFAAPNGWQCRGCRATG